MSLKRCVTPRFITMNIFVSIVNSDNFFVLLMASFILIGDSVVRIIINEEQRCSIRVVCRVIRLLPSTVTGFRTVAISKWLKRNSAAYNC